MHQFSLALHGGSYLFGDLWFDTVGVNGVPVCLPFPLYLQSLLTTILLLTGGEPDARRGVLLLRYALCDRHPSRRLSRHGLSESVQL
jgi:hypothetical protein